MTGSAMSRRAFLARSGVVAGSAVLVGSGVAGAQRLLAREPQPRWREPAVRASQNGRLETQLRITEQDVQIAGKPARALTYESSYPGPTLDVRPGDELAVDLINAGKQPTNLHTHGLHVTPQAPSDDVLLHINPGETFNYRYQLPADHPGGTFWYHAHLHGRTDDQVFAGLFGLLIVRGALDELPGVAGLEERSLIFSQMEVVDGKVADASSSSLSDQVTLVNGRFQPTLRMRTGETQRWRLMNTSSIFLRLSLESLGLNVIAFDGNALPAPIEKDILEIPPGGRADVLVQAPEAGKFRLRSMSWKSLGVFYTSMVPNPQVLAGVVVEGPARVEPAPLPTELLPVDDLKDVAIDRRRVFRLEEREPRGVGPLDAFEYYINGRRFDMSRVNEQVPLDATEEWEFRNLTYEPHPLHIHTNPFQVVAIDGDRSRAENHYRDSALIPPFGSLTIRHRFLDFTGYLVMHCHILFHEDHGMMQLIEIYGPEGPGPIRLPEHEMHRQGRAAPAWTCPTGIGRSA